MIRIIWASHEGRSLRACFPYTVLSNSKVWVLDRRVFQQIMMRTGLQRLEDNINFLRSVPLLHNLSNDVLAKIADVLEVVSLFTIMSDVSRCDCL